MTNRRWLAALAASALVGAVCLLVAPGGAGASSLRSLYFTGSARLSGYDLGGGRSFSPSVSFKTVGMVDASRAGPHEPLCRAFGRGAFRNFGPTSGADPRPTFPTPGFGVSVDGPDGSTHLFSGVAPTWVGTSPRTFTETGPPAAFPNDPFTNDAARTNEPFQIDRDHYAGPSTFTITIKRNGSGSVVEASPHSYSETWTCSAKPLFVLSGTISDATGQGVGRIEVRAVGRDGAHTTQTDATGEYAFDLAGGRYTVAPVGVRAHPTALTVSVKRDTPGVNFSIDDTEHVSASFDPPSVRGDGFGFARLIVKVTDSAGKPVGGRHVTVAPRPIGDSNSIVPERDIVCALDGHRVSPLRLFNPPFSGRTPVQLGIKTFTTDDNGTVEVVVFAGRRDFDVLVQDLKAKPAEVTSVLHVDQAGGALATPHQLQSELGGSVDFVNASTAQIQMTLLEAFGQLHARRLAPSHFVPLTANSAGAVGVASTFYAEGQSLGTADNGGSGDVPILDARLALSISLPNTLNLPDHIPTIDEWISANPEFPFPSGVVTVGHERRLLSDAITYFEDWPIPPADLRLRAVFERCVPELGQPVSIDAQLFSPLQLSFVDPHGRQLGFDAHGKRHLEIPGGLLMNGHPQLYTVPPGNYTIRLRATGTGKATVEFTYPSHGATAAIRAFTLQVRRGQTATLKVNHSAPSATLRLGGRVIHATNGLAMVVRGIPKRLRAGRTHTATVRVVDQTARPVIGAVLTVTGSKLHVTAATGSNGTARLRLQGRRGGVNVKVAALGYLSTRFRIATGK